MSRYLLLLSLIVCCESAASTGVLVPTNRERTDSSLKVTLARLKEASCSADHYIAQFDSGNSAIIESCRELTDMSCECKVKLPPKSDNDEVSFRFRSSGDDVVRAARPSLLRSLSTEEEGAAGVAVAAEPMAAENPHHTETPGIVKTIHSFFVLVAFAGNAAFLVFVFWLSKI